MHKIVNTKSLMQTNGIIIYNTYRIEQLLLLPIPTARSSFPFPMCDSNATMVTPPQPKPLPYWIIHAWYFTFRSQGFLPQFKSLETFQTPSPLFRFKT